ncbi:MAG: hypothetical protein FJX45_09115 [Alphaproteobacteria bacterium]|nr:hypothetical protein [Alphaproteobacteria bacterium]MBM3651434.1 hypothetical protein [Alphaproteobacteria bacterium]
MSVLPIRISVSTPTRILIDGRYLIIYQPRPDGAKMMAIVRAMRNPVGWRARPPRTYAQSFT